MRRIKERREKGESRRKDENKGGEEKEGKRVNDSEGAEEREKNRRELN